MDRVDEKAAGTAAATGRTEAATMPVTSGSPASSGSPAAAQADRGAHAGAGPARLSVNDAPVPFPLGDPGAKVPDPRIALLFAGQGAQHEGMGRAIADANDAARAALLAFARVRPGTVDQCFGASMEELSRTIVTQPCVMAVDLACAAAVASAGVWPGHVAGFSLGELAALTFAGCIEPKAAVHLVCERAELMDAACGERPGTMCAVLKLAPHDVEELATRAGAWAVNYNAPAQTVCAGTAEAIGELAALVKEAGGRCMPLAVSGAFHSPFMASASEGLAAYLAQHPVAGSPDGTVWPVVWSNVTGAPYPRDGAAACDLLARQASSPVRWTATLAGMAGAGVQAFVEVGPGKVLTGLVKKTLPDALALHVETPENLEQTLDALRGAGLL